MDTSEKLSRLARAWDEAAAQYDAYFVPRFAGWRARALQTLPKDLPNGRIVVPCCGTGPELVELAERFPSREVLGVDLSPGMVQLANERIRGRGQLSARVADASHTEDWGACAAVFSIFGLQQMPAPVAAIEAWTKALVPGGMLCVVFWPASVEEEGPFAWLAEAMEGMGPAPSIHWEGDVAPGVVRAGGQLLIDEEIPLPMNHGSAEEAWQAMMGSGPGRALLAARGNALVQLAHERFLSIAPAGPIVHWPSARLVVARRP